MIVFLILLATAVGSFSCFFLREKAVLAARGLLLQNRNLSALEFLIPFTTYVVIASFLITLWLAVAGLETAGCVVVAVLFGAVASYRVFKEAKGV